MIEVVHPILGWNNWLGLFGHYLMLSLLSVGGPIATTPEMHRYLVDEQHWLSHTQFSQSIALAQAAPGPNMLFVALMGWHIGMNTGGAGAALLAVATTLLGILLPSSLLMMTTAQWGHRNRDLRAVRAFRQGMAPVVIAMLLSTSWILGSASRHWRTDWALWLVAVVSGLVLWRTRLHLLWVLGAGAVLGWFQLL
jgi:chromate transporter